MPFIAILEDSMDRFAAMRAHLDKLEGYEIYQTERAPEFIEWAKEHLAECALISLDNDLAPHDGTDNHAGEGRDVADWMGPQPPACPVIIHSSNGTAVASMRTQLEIGGWEVDRAVPWNHLEWVDDDWAPLMKRMLGLEAGD